MSKALSQKLSVRAVRRGLLRSCSTLSSHVLARLAFAQAESGDGSVTLFADA
jgi:hypothetical protein